MEISRTQPEPKDKQEANPEREREVDAKCSVVERCYDVSINHACVQLEESSFFF